MKKLKTLRKIVSFVLCFAMAVSAFSVLAVAEEAKAETASAYACGVCGGLAKWFPGSDIVTSYTHPYFIYGSDGEAKEQICTVYVTTYYEGCVCTSCGALLLENSYVKNIEHRGCGA